MADVIPPQEVRPSAESVPAVSPVSPEIAQTPQPKDLLIVFGQGPVKPLFRREDFNPQVEADKERLDQWDKFKKDPLRSNEPDFRILEGEQALSLEGLSTDQIESRMIELQNQGRFGLNRWGRQNGVMAGFAAFSGHSERVLLSGGKTIPEWAKAKLSPKRLEAWPSEAQLMKDIIVRRFGRLYKEKYGKPITNAILTEDRSTNTLENFANTVNLNPEVLEKGVASGLASDFHVPRTERIGFLFTGEEVPGDSAQVLNQSRLDAANKRREGINVLNTKTGEAKPAGNKEAYQEILDWMIDPKNEELEKKSSNEREFDGALQDPDFLTYWIGYVGIVEDPRVLQKTVQRLSSDPRYSEAATQAFGLAGIDFSKLSGKDLTIMPKNEFDSVREKLRILMTKEYRRMPGKHVMMGRT